MSSVESDKSLAKLLALYPRLSVSRDRVGVLTVSRNLGLTKRLVMNLGDVDNPAERIQINCWEVTKTKFGEMMSLELLGQGDRRTIKGITYDWRGEYDPRRVIEDVTHGVEIFTAFLGLGDLTRAAFRRRVSDWIQRTDFRGHQIPPESLSCWSELLRALRRPATIESD